MYKPIRAEVSPGSKRTLSRYHETHEGQGLDNWVAIPGVERSPEGYTWVSAWLVPIRAQISYRLHYYKYLNTGYSTWYWYTHTTRYTITPITNPNTVQARRGEEKHSPKYKHNENCENFEKLRTRTPQRGNTKARSEWGFGPLVAAGPREVFHHLVVT